MLANPGDVFEDRRTRINVRVGIHQQNYAPVGSARTNSPARSTEISPSTYRRQISAASGLVQVLRGARWQSHFARTAPARRGPLIPVGQSVGIAADSSSSLPGLPKRQRYPPIIPAPRRMVRMVVIAGSHRLAALVTKPVARALFPLSLPK